MKNKRHHAYTGGSVTLPLIVPNGTKSGDIVPLGSAGLYGVAETDQVTADQITTGKYPQGYVAGQAGVFLPGIVMTLTVPTLTGIADYAKVYRAADGTLSTTNTGTYVGWRLGATTLGLRPN